MMVKNMTITMGTNSDAKVQMKQAEQTEQITDYAAELEKTMN